MLRQRRQRISRLVRLLVAARAVNQLGAFSLAFSSVLPSSSTNRQARP